MIKLTKQAQNLRRLELDNITIWFSYEAPIAYDLNDVGTLVITKNIWSSTTGKHLNMINPDRSIRIEYHEFIKLLEEALQ